MNHFRTALAGLFVASFCLLSFPAFSQDTSASSTDSSATPAIPPAPDGTSGTGGTGTGKSSLSDEDVARFTNTIVLIKDFYVEKVGDDKLLDNAVRGMVSGLDPHSEYLDKEA